MTKDRRGRSASREEEESVASSRQSTEPPPSEADIKEWEEARCPVCMEHPHNAVLLLCSAHNKGCRPFMCDTSHRHSNCLDQFRKAASLTPKSDPKCAEILCPLCRGAVKTWTIISAARAFMNNKSRDCSLESCKFAGTYEELRRHARTEHSTMRPADADPERQRNWMRMERQRDIGDLISTIQPLVDDGEATEELEASVLMNPRVMISLYVRIPHLQEEVVSEHLPRLVISFRPRSSETGGVLTRRRRRLTPQWGEIVDGGMPVIHVDDEGDDDNDARDDDVRVLRGSSSRQRRRRWLRTPDEDDGI